MAERLRGVARKGSDAKLRVAVLDLGSTSFHLLVTDASPTGKIERVARRRSMLRLGATIAEEGAIPKPIASRAVEAARALRRVAEEHGVDRLLPVATAALRDASNGAPLTDSIAKALGTPVRLLSGLEEARLIFAAFRPRIPLRDSVALGMDPLTVIRAMTLDAARVMGADRESGSIAEGKFADVIAVRGDPLRHIDVLRDPRIVIKHGRRVK